jgi:hypothetical protein
VESSTRRPATTEMIVMTYPRVRLMTLTAVIAVLASSAFAGAEIDPALDFSPTPGVACRADDMPETNQGRVPAADLASGRAAQGYTCNASQVSHIGGQPEFSGSLGGYRVHRYTDKVGHVCAFYDTTLLFPANLSAEPTDTGVWVLDMTDPARPTHTATLRTLAMQSPHESLSLNTKRGLLGAVFANPAAHAGQFDLYDLTHNCLQPTLAASLPVGILGHEGSFAPDGNTYYAASLYGHTVTAISTSNTLAPTIVWTSAQWNMHGMNVSDDGNLLYFADVGRSNGEPLGEPAGTATRGLTVLDVSQVQARVPNPVVSIVSHLTWPHVGTPQTAIPVTIQGHSYLVEIDEFGGADNVGAARMIDIADPAKPRVVSNMRLAVNNLAQQNDASQKADPGASNSLGGYRGHYCGVPSQVDPGIVACTFILSGLRVFDIHDPAHPTEIAYFNRPATWDQYAVGARGPQGAYAMSQPAFDVGKHQIWYSDGNTGFYVVQIAPEAWPF